MRISEYVGNGFALDFNSRDSFRAILIDEVGLCFFGWRRQRLKFARLLARVGTARTAGERWIGSCRGELLDHVIVLSENHLRRLIRDYLHYYHEDRIQILWTKTRPSEERSSHGE